MDFGAMATKLVQVLAKNGLASLETLYRHHVCIRIGIRQLSIQVVCFRQACQLFGGWRGVQAQAHREPCPM